ncbi:hypothetical protein L596_023816 [Steinernema carpocapsae]|uniref:Uncharacterized protein n=1 Tax=Steinernema carpocapsae TaxID=34508 RepID=A0A4U5MEV1_STECR|nr:hypothetical protein L596_023816 [Steinernema carpocapsae]
MDRGRRFAEMQKEEEMPQPAAAWQPVGWTKRAVITQRMTSSLAAAICNREMMIGSNGDRRLQRLEDSRNSQERHVQPSRMP